jgi:hypothetical protein
MPNSSQQKDIFCNVAAAQASGQRNTISVHSAAGKVYIDHLVLTPEQRTKITMLYNTPGQIYDTQYQWNVEEDQAAAAGELATHRLDMSSREALDNQWSVHWTNDERKGEPKDLISMVCKFMFRKARAHIHSQRLWI